MTFRLLDAVLKGEWKEVEEKLLEKSSSAGLDDINQQDSLTGPTALMAAAESTRVNIVELLLKRGATARLFNNEGLNVLMMAASQGNLDIVKLLVEYDRNLVVSCCSATGINKFKKWTPIMFAADKGHHHIVKYFKEKTHGIITSAQVQDFIRDNNLAAVNVCLSINRQSVWPSIDTIILYALQYKSEQIFEFFYDKFTGDQKKKIGQDYLSYHKIDTDLWPWLVKRGVFTASELLTGIYTKEKESNIIRAEMLYWSAIMKSFYESSFSPIQSPVVVACDSDAYHSGSIEVETHSVSDIDNVDSDIHPLTAFVTFPTPIRPPPPGLPIRNPRSFVTEIRTWIHITQTTVSKIIDFVKTKSAASGSYFLDIYFEDLGASGMGGYRFNEYDLFVRRGGDMVYCNKYHVNPCYTAFSFLKGFSTIEEFVENLYGEYLYQKKEYHLPDDDDIFRGRFLLQLENGYDLARVREIFGGGVFKQN
jgi:hypothetical protein